VFVGRVTVLPSVIVSSSPTTDNVCLSTQNSTSLVSSLIVTFVPLQPIRVKVSLFDVALIMPTPLVTFLNIA
jgi:hypothetical protein